MTLLSIPLLPSWSLYYANIQREPTETINYRVLFEPIENFLKRGATFKNLHPNNFVYKKKYQNATR